MLEHRRFVGLLSAQLIGFWLLVAAPAFAGPKNSAATKLANQAMQTDYLGAQFKKAEQKLKKAAQLCGASDCSYDVVARLHRDLATVYIGGMNQVPKGKAELKLALAANPELQLDSDLATPELRKAFKAAGGHGPKSSADKDDDDDASGKKTKTEKKAKDEDCSPGSEGCDVEASGPAEPEAAAPEEAAASGKAHKNWLSVNFEQDFLVYSAHNDVCASYGPPFHPEAAGYSCFQSGTQYGYAPGQTIYPGVGNHLAGGVGVATSRILLGLDRLLTANFSVGARLGFAFGGAPVTNGGEKFLPLHAELRANYWFGTDPFESSGLRPYLEVSLGLAEVDGHVPVEYYQSQQGYNSSNKGSLDAWRKAGKVFSGVGFGMMIPFAGSSGIVPEVRVLGMLGATALAFDASLGYAFGF